MLRHIEQDYHLMQGSYLEIPLYYPDFDDDGNLLAVDITTAVINCKFRKTASSPVVLNLSTTTSTIEIVDALAGTFKLKFPSALTSAITEKTPVLYKGHVEVTLSGETYRTHSLYLFFSPEFT